MALTARLAAFREELARRKLTGFVIPRADQQQNEYVAPSEERLAWLTGFTGSAGMAVVLTREAAVFVDGRYTLQAAKQVDRKAWTSSRWSIRRRKTGWRGTCQPATASDLIPGCTLLRQPSGWPRPAPRPARNWSRSTATRSMRSGMSARRRRSARSPMHGLQFSGETEAEKLKRIRLEIAKLGVDALVLSDSPRRGLDLQHPRRRRRRIRRCRCPMRWCRRTAGRPSSSTIENSPTEPATISSNPPMSREPDALAPKLTRSPRAARRSRSTAPPRPTR